MIDHYAIQPEAFTYKTVKKEQESIYAKLQREDEAFWTNLKLHGVYPRLKKYIMDLCDSLDQYEEVAYKSGATVEEIGVRRIVNRLTRSNLMSLITKVERTSEVINARQKGGEQGDSKK